MIEKNWLVSEEQDRPQSSQTYRLNIFLHGHNERFLPNTVYSNCFFNPFLASFPFSMHLYLSINMYIYSFTDELQMSGGDNQIKQLKMYISTHTKLYKSI